MERYGLNSGMTGIECLGIEFGCGQSRKCGKGRLALGGCWVGNTMVADLSGGHFPRLSTLLNLSLAADFFGEQPTQDA